MSIFTFTTQLPRMVTATKRVKRRKQRRLGEGKGLLCKHLLQDAEGVGPQKPGVLIFTPCHNEPRPNDLVHFAFFAGCAITNDTPMFEPVSNEHMLLPSLPLREGLGMKCETQVPNHIMHPSIFGIKHHEGELGTNNLTTSMVLCSHEQR